MSSATDICNSALMQIGAQRIASLDDNTDAARTCKELFQKIRDKLLRQHPWNFSIKRIALAQETTTPASDYSFQYGIPADCLRVLGNDDKKFSWTVEGRMLLTNASAVTIRYISRIEDVNQWDSLFVEAMELLLASRLSIALMNNPDVSAQKFNEFRAFLIDARLTDGLEGTGDTIYSEDLIEARMNVFGTTRRAWWEL